VGSSCLAYILCISVVGIEVYVSHTLASVSILSLYDYRSPRLLVILRYPVRGEHQWMLYMYGGYGLRGTVLSSALH
jgi:hypothetical protein